MKQEKLGERLVLQVVDNQRPNACADCRYACPDVMWCNATGGLRTADIRNQLLARGSYHCPHFKPAPPTPERVGFLRWLWRLIW